MERLRLWMLLVVIVAVATLIFATTDALPASVGSHFGPGGAADGFMTRDFYRWYMSAFASLLPLSIYAAIGWLPTRIPRLTNLPDKDHWFAPARREVTLATLAGFGTAIGIWASLFIGGVHLLLLQANALSPPRLAEGPFYGLLGAFMIGMIVLILAMRARFRRR